MSLLSGNRWTSKDIPDLDGKKVIVTGANSGLGFEASKMFAEKNAHVVMACRSLEKGKKARKKIERKVGEVSLEVRKIDLASLESIKDFAQEYKANNDSLDVLCNNAGVMAIPRSETKDGFEKQFGINHLGHFALTGHLIDLLLDTEGSSVVTQSSGLHENGDIDFDDLMMEENYDKWDAYAQSKLANVLFGYELDRKLENKEVKSVVCHPGYASTDLQYKGPREEGSKIRLGLMKLANTFVAQSARKGALSMMYASTSNDIEGGEYVGPTGLANMRGYPGVQESSDISYDRDVAKALWTRSEDMTGLRFDLD